MTAEIQAEIAGLQRYADGQDRQIAELERRYGTGTRPAFVGDEIAIMSHHAKQARAKADSLDAATV